MGFKEVKENLQNMSSQEKKCPFCAEMVLMEARKCKHCGEILDEALKNEVSAQSWNPGVAAVLSLIIPGAGQLYKGHLFSALV